MTLIVALGDSTTAGTPGFRSPLESPPSGEGNMESQYAFWLERARPAWRVMNRGVDGERADQILARFHRDVLADPPDVVIIIAGVNDIYQGRAPDRVTQQLTEMYDLAVRAGIDVIAGTILPYDTAGAVENSRMAEVNRWIRFVTGTRPGIWFADTRAAVAHPEDPDRLGATPDRLHPSVEGYRRMAGALLPAVERALVDRLHRGSSSRRPRPG